MKKEHLLYQMFQVAFLMDYKRLVKNEKCIKLSYEIKKKKKQEQRNALKQYNGGSANNRRQTLSYPETFAK